MKNNKDKRPFNKHEQKHGLWEIYNNPDHGFEYCGRFINDVHEGYHVMRDKSVFKDYYII